MDYTNPNDPSTQNYQSTPGKPKKCLARAIVSMVLGINSAILGLVNIVLAIAVAIIKISTVLIYSRNYGSGINITSHYGVSIGSAGSILLMTYAIIIVIYAIACIILGAISLSQGKKFYTLYEVSGSKMITAGKITSIIGMVCGGIAVVLTLVFLMM